jgi:hypothetical protein
MKVAIIGAGPAGLAAAHAAWGLGHEVVIIAPKKKTPQLGPLMIQRPIPGINTSHPDGTIYQKVIGGTIMDYRYKLYGDINIGINGDQLRECYHGWNHRDTYEKLWARYAPLIQDRLVSSPEMADMHNAYDLVVSTANAHAMCFNRVPSTGHSFLSAPVAITPRSEYPEHPDNLTIFNGGEDREWVRCSKIFGAEFTEWPVNCAPENARIIHKPISTDCTCYPHVLRTGRFGKWKNEVWVDTAYYDTYEALVSMARKDELDLIK